MEVGLFDELVRLRQKGQKAALATIIRIQGSGESTFQSGKMLVREDGSVLGTVGGGGLEAEVWTAAQEAIKDEQSRVLNFDLSDNAMADSGLICGHELEIFVEPVLPVPRIVIFGAGHISVQLSKIAAVAGFRSWVVDDRPIYANPSRFPEAERIFSDSFKDVFPQIEPDHSTYLIVVTRGHQDDECVLRWGVETDARYIGMIGSKKKIRALVHKLEFEGISGERLERVHMPIGLDIGAIAPGEIAVAIVAEMIHFRRRNQEHPFSKKICATIQP